MVQRILEPGQIETLAQRSIPRVRLPDRASLFARRAARLHRLADANAIGDYLHLLGALSEAQHAALATFAAALPDPAQIAQAAAHRMPPVSAASYARDPAWIALLHQLLIAVTAMPGMPVGVAQLSARLQAQPQAQIETQADALLAHDEPLDVAAAPFIMAALQVHWVALTSAFAAEHVALLDVPGLCPLCGTLPVASIVRAQTPYTGYRYLHCALCACEWHMVRVQCSQCGAIGKDIAYHALQDAHASDTANALQSAAVRAETCAACRSYRKILYQEHDVDVDPVADDLATLALDVLLGERDYHRASGNPLLWQSAQA